MTVNDWVSAYRIGITRSRFDVIKLAAFGAVTVPLAFAVSVSYDGYVHAWQRHHVVPWHYIHMILLATCFGPISFVLFTSFFLWSGATRTLTLQNPGIVIHVKASKNVISWKRVSTIFKNTEYVAICSDNFNALVIPCRAFPSEQAAEDFYATALLYWHEAKGTTPPPASIAGVWPPAPAIADSAEPGDAL